MATSIKITTVVILSLFSSLIPSTKAQDSPPESEPPSKKLKTESGQACAVDAPAATAAAPAATAAAAAAAAPSVRVSAPPSLSPCKAMRDDTLDMQLIKQGAEGRVYSCTFLGRPCIMKERFRKEYRHPLLESRLCLERLRAEVRALAKARRQTALADQAYAPAVFLVDEDQRRIYMEKIQGDTVKDKMHTLSLDKPEDEQTGFALAKKIGKAVAGIHNAGIVHGDLTTSNLMLVPKPDDALGGMVVIDFGLATVSQLNEDRAVDLYVLERAFLSTHPNSEKMFAEVLKSYQASFNVASKVLSKLNIVRSRGRKRQMVG